MIADCENGKIDLILTKEVSRFVRNTVDTLNFTRKLSDLKIGVIFMNDGIDTRDKDGELRLTTMASIAQEESRKVSERVKWGIRRKKEEGWVYGYSRMLGYKTENGQLEIVPEETEVVRRIFHSYVYKGKGCHTIANELNAAGLFTVRGKMSKEGRKFSKHYWFSSKVFCGRCGYSYNISGNTSREKRPLRCVNRAKYGNIPRIDANGAEVGCDSKAINETVLVYCMKYILEQIQVSRAEIVGQLLEEIKIIQNNESAVNCEPLKEEIENLSYKKRKAIALMLDDLISKENLKKQSEFYDSEIARLTEKIAESQNVGAVHQKQLERNTGLHKASERNRRNGQRQH